MPNSSAQAAHTGPADTECSQKGGTVMSSAFLSIFINASGQENKVESQGECMFYEKRRKKRTTVCGNIVLPKIYSTKSHLSGSSHYPDTQDIKLVADKSAGGLR